MLGVVAHVDVVPEGEGWIHPPYAAEIADGRIYGRGTMDDKGPAVCAIYALAAIKAAGIPMRRRVRIILGTNEETGWGCMDHYRKVAEIPTLTFSPDADYPVVNSEKGIYHATMRCNAKTNIRINGGTRANVVCGKVKAFVPVEITDSAKMQCRQLLQCLRNSRSRARTNALSTFFTTGSDLTCTAKASVWMFPTQAAG